LPYTSNILKSAFSFGPINSKLENQNNIFAFGNITGELRVYYDFYSQSLISETKQNQITALCIGSIRNSENNSLLVGSLDGQISIYHLEKLEGYFSAHSFKGKPSEGGYGNLAEEMKKNTNEMGLDLTLLEEELKKSGSLEDSIREKSENNLKNTENNNETVKIITPDIKQKIQANIDIIKCEKVYLNSIKNEDCIFICTKNGNLFIYKLECNPSDFKGKYLEYNKFTKHIEIKEKASVGYDAFSLVCLKNYAQFGYSNV